jgi:hypothetical protein
MERHATLADVKVLNTTYKSTTTATLDSQAITKSHVLSLHLPRRRIFATYSTWVDTKCEEIQPVVGYLPCKQFLTYFTPVKEDVLTHVSVYSIDPYKLKICTCTMCRSMDVTAN